MVNLIYYQNRISAITKDYEKAKRVHQIFGLCRLGAFVALIGSVYFAWGSLWLVLFFGLFVSVFLFFVHLSENAKQEKNKKKKLIELNQSELKVLNGDWQDFKDGSEYRDPKHAFAHDMDIFGKKSFFQLVNRTVSKNGSDALAMLFLQGSPNVELTHAAIQELVNHIDWCQDFLAEGLVLEESERNKELNSILSLSAKESKRNRYLRLIIPISSPIVIVLFLLNLLSEPVFLFYMIGVLFLIGNNLKRTNHLCNQVTAYSSQVTKMLNQLALYEKMTFYSPLLQQDKEALFSSENNLMTALLELSKIQKRMDYRMNILVGVVLNLVFAWDLQVAYSWEKWRVKQCDYLSEWESKIAMLEVWISGAIYHFNFPTTSFAQFNSNETISITGLGHPFVAPTKQVLNNVVFSEGEHFLIITGPNMAGKSTYLRSLGLVFICANAGFPILASSCEIPKLKLYSSMRTSDDLTVESSYFHAELSRLRFIVDAIEAGEKVFVILDEILKGTNSKDKEIGSAKFLQKLERLRTKGVIATHDLSLCTLADLKPSFSNWYFDSTISGANLSFDYKIRQGICQNMNASFLLKQLKLVDE